MDGSKLKPGTARKKGKRLKKEILPRVPTLKGRGGAYDEGGWTGAIKANDIPKNRKQIFNKNNGGIRHSEYPLSENKTLRSTSLPKIFSKLA